MERPAPDLLHALLDAHTPADGREADSLRRIQKLLKSAPDPYSRTLYVPGHLTASALVVDPDRERTLLIFHAKLRLWLQPGGHFEPGERDPWVSAAREVLEETRLPTRLPEIEARLLDVDVHAIPARGAEPDHFHFDLRMLLVAEHLPAQAGDAGVREARWFTLRELAALDLDPGLGRALRKAGLNG